MPGSARRDSYNRRLLAAGAERAGALVMLVEPRELTRRPLSNLGFLVVPEQVGVPRAGSAFDADGALIDERQRGSVETVGAAVATLAARLRMAPG